jgi:hypothetical protein
VVEGARLESVYRGDSIVGSNPTVSAKTLSMNVDECRKNDAITPFVVNRLSMRVDVYRVTLRPCCIARYIADCVFG